MLTVFAFQSLVLTVVVLVLFVVKAWAFIDSLTHPAEAYVAAGKLTKAAWSVILGVFLVAHVLIPGVVNLLNIIGTVAAFVYLLDVRPALRALTRR